MEPSPQRIDEAGPVDGRADSPRELPSLVDWGIGAVLTVVGLVLAAVGWLLSTQVNRAEIADAVEGESVSVVVGDQDLSPAEAVDAAVPLIDWLAIGLGATAAVLVVGGVGFAVLRRRTRKRVAREGGTTGTAGAHSMYGAAAGAVLSFIPFSTALGGAIAGYLRNGQSPSGAKVGAITGVLGTIPVAVLTLGVVVGAAGGASAIGEGAAGTLLALLGVVVLLVLALVNAGLGALGGALGKRI
jgi:hypothetical protein